MIFGELYLCNFSIVFLVEYFLNINHYNAQFSLCLFYCDLAKLKFWNIVDQCTIFVKDWCYFSVTFFFHKKVVHFSQKIGVFFADDCVGQYRMSAYKIFNF